MSVMSEIAKRTAVPDANGLTVDPIRLQCVIGRWLMFSDYGAAAQRHMIAGWSCVLGCALADAIWLPNSRLSFASSNWPGLLLGIVCCAIAGAFIAVALNRLRKDESRAAIVLRGALIRTQLLWQAALPIGALLVAGVTLSYLITAANLPLWDAQLARLDRDLGFDWLRFMDATNSSPLFASLLAHAYNTTGPISQLAIVWLALNRRGERLAEFIAVLGLSTIGVIVGMWLVPAAGAFAYYEPGPQLIANFAALGEMWPFEHDFTALRNGTLLVIDLSALQGVVSFPSFHTMLGVMTTYALRDTRWLMIPVLLLNGTMIVATPLVGGHHLADVLAGAALTLGAILLTRHSADGPRKISWPGCENRAS